MAINWADEANTWIIQEFGNALFSHFGYAAIAAAAALFKLAIAATLVSYGAFLCATLLGGFVTYFPTRAIMFALDSLELKQPYVRTIGAALQFGLSPIIGASILNLALGLSLPLMPLLAVGGASLVIGFTAVFAMITCSDDHSNQLSSARQGYRANALHAAPRAEKKNENAVLLSPSN